MTAFSDWLTVTMAARKLSLRAVAERAGVGHTTVRSWREGIARPTWENCIAIAKALRVDDALVRSLAGYSDVGGDTYIAEATLTPEEDQIVQAWRTASAEGRRLLLDADAVFGTPDDAIAAGARQPCLRCERIIEERAGTT